jgi:LPXTG-motif cell wall-anchored protein
VPATPPGPAPAPTAAPLPRESVAPTPTADAEGQVARIPVGAPETGGGPGDGPDGTTWLLLGGLGLAGAGGAVVLRRRSTAADGRG